MSRVRTEVWEKTHHDQLPWVNTSLIGDYALNPEPAPMQAADELKAASTAGVGQDRQSQEDLVWQSAQHSNLRADYQAYLEAFPNGVFAQMAKNRVANLEEPGVARSGTDWKSEIGTEETEKALNLTPAEQAEIQQRLTALGLYQGPLTGTFNAPTRAAIFEWQKSRGVALSSLLGPMQLAELRAESEDAHQTLLAPQSAPPAEAVKYPARPVTRAARASARRHAAKRSSSSSASSSASAPTASESLLGYFGRQKR
jgi:hypothetical protein